jgi:hypothetical protein
VGKGKTREVSPSTVCIKTIWIVDVGNVLKNILRSEANYTKRLPPNQKFVSVVAKYLSNGH